MRTRLVAFALVGSQVGWMLRPLVGSPNIRVEFVRYVTHTAAPGDDFTTLAILYGIPPTEIRKLNDLPDTAKLKPGMKVRVPKP